MEDFIQKWGALLLLTGVVWIPALHYAFSVAVIGIYIGIVKFFKWSIRKLFVKTVILSYNQDGNTNRNTNRNTFEFFSERDFEI